MASRPDGRGVADSIPDASSLVGKVGKNDVLLVRTAGRFFAVGAHCTHYTGALAEGSWWTTDSLPAASRVLQSAHRRAAPRPRFDPIPRWRVEQRDGQVFVLDKERRRPRTSRREAPASVVIVGGGGAGLAAADMLRREGYHGPITMVSADATRRSIGPTCRRTTWPATPQDDWIPLWPPEFYAEHRIELLLGASVVDSIPPGEAVTLEDGIAPRPSARCCWRPAPSPSGCRFRGHGAHVHYLRTLRRQPGDRRARPDAQARRRRSAPASSASRWRPRCARAALPWTSSRRTSVPLERVMGPEVGRFVRTLHEAHGVVFHLGQTVDAVDGRRCPERRRHA